MSTHNIPFLIIKTNHPKLSKICNYEISSKGPKNEFETAVVNEPSVFEPLKFNCIEAPNTYTVCHILAYSFALKGYCTVLTCLKLLELTGFVLT